MPDHSIECRRKNQTLASVIELAVSYQEALGYPSAKIFLMEQAVDQDIIKRVLACPDRRRGARDQPSAA
jgi:hypothetical protein